MALWHPSREEEDALAHQGHVATMGRVDQIWPWLAQKHGQILAVDAPHAAHPERFCYGELAAQIALAAAAFRHHGIGSGEVVAFFAENSPRWLVADQGLMRTGAANAVRGATAPVEELRYILEDSGAIALVVQSAELWHKLALTEEQKRGLRLVLQLEGEPADGLLGWDALLAAGAGQPAPDPFKDRARDSAASAPAIVIYTSCTE
ncbi:MAG: AMP-binding protein, partial [Prochlorococcus sp.]